MFSFAKITEIRKKLNITYKNPEKSNHLVHLHVKEFFRDLFFSLIHDGGWRKAKKKKISWALVKRRRFIITL